MFDRFMKFHISLPTSGLNSFNHLLIDFNFKKTKSNFSWWGHHFWVQKECQVKKIGVSKISGVNFFGGAETEHSLYSIGNWGQRFWGFLEVGNFPYFNNTI